MKSILTADAKPDDHQRYRFFWIVPKTDFEGKGFFIEGEWVKEGYVVTDGVCNVMPGATWFRTIPSAVRAIDVWIAVRGNAEMFWEIMQPFNYTPGDNSDARECNIGKGRHYAIVKNFRVVEIGTNDEPAEVKKAWTQPNVYKLNDGLVIGGRYAE